MKVRKQLGLLFCVGFFSIIGLFSIVGAEQWGFVNPQTDCKINCLNNGVCVFDRENESHHKCICVIGEFEGDFCENRVTSTTATPEPSAVATDGQGQAYDEEDEFHEAASQDLHYTEFTNGRDTEEVQKLDDPTPTHQSTNQADDYAEFEPHNDEVYHEAVIQPSERVHEPISMEPQTEATVYIETSQSSYHPSEQPTEEEIDDFYEDDASWMLFKRKARNGAEQHQKLLLPLSIATMFFLRYAL